MATILSASLNVAKIDQTKLIDGRTGKFLNVTIVINDEVDKFGNNASIFESQSKEEREAKTPKNYLGNAKIIWTTENKNNDLPF
jgi:putative transposon-encoded protein